MTTTGGRVDPEAADEGSRALRLLRILARTANAANDAASLEEALPRVLGTVCELLRWDAGHAWIAAEDDSGDFVPTGVWHLASPHLEPLRDATAAMRFAKGHAVPRRLLAWKSTLWAVDAGLSKGAPRLLTSAGRRVPLAADAHSRQRLGWELGLRSFFQVPIWVRDAPVGVLEFAAARREAVDADLVEALAQVGAQVARVIERERAAHELRRREEHLRAVLGALVDVPVVIVDREGRVVEAFSVLPEGHGVSARTVLDVPAARWLPADELEPMLAALREVFATGQPRRLEHGLLLPAGRTWIDLRLYPLRDAAGAVENVLCLVYDLTPRKTLEDALRASERRYHALADSVAVGIYRTDEKGSCVYANPRTAEITGLAPEALLGSGWVAGVHPEDRERLRVEGSAARLAKRPFLAEFRQLRPDGAVSWVALRAVPESDAGDGCTVGTLTDITELKRMEAALRESERFAQRLAEVSPVGIFRLDPTGQLTYANPRLSEVAGVTPEQSRTDGWLRRLVPEAAAARGEALRAIAQGETFSIVLCFGDPVGPRRWALSQGAPDRDESGRLRGYVGTLTDITELKRMEAALREGERFFSRLAAISPVGIYRTDPAGVPGYMNERCCEIWGLSREQLGTWAWLEALDPQDRDRFLEERRRSIAERRLLHHELRHRRPDGSQAWALIQSIPDVDADGRVVGHVGTVTDISESKRVAEELARHRDRLGDVVAERTAELESTYRRLRDSERLAAVGTFAAGIAHQINNPVGGMLLAAQFAQDKLDDRRVVAEALENVVIDARRCGRIVRGVLEFARGDLGDRGPCDLNAIVRDACEQLRADVLERGAAIGLLLAESLPAILASEPALDQVVVNLIQNALEAGARRIELHSSCDESRVTLRVCDDGRGIAPADLEHVLDPFFTTRSGRGGTGLGLALAQGIVRGHGGELGIESRLGQGTSVCVCLPVAPRA